jgi:hypothetical protein
MTHSGSLEESEYFQIPCIGHPEMVANLLGDFHSPCQGWRSNSRSLLFDRGLVFQRVNYGKKKPENKSHCGL